NSASRATLRTKTGCLTCRKRRKKCDERLPICDGCNLSRRHCQWPTLPDLLDRRFASHNRSRYNQPQTAIAHFKPLGTTVDSELATFSKVPAAQGVVSRDPEPVVLRHFMERFYSLLILPNCHPSFYNGWLIEIQDLIVHHKGLYYSVLACAASHIYCANSSSQMQELSLTYYSNSIRELVRFLTRASRLENDNGLLMSVMLLCLQGCYGCDTYDDLPHHVAAATHILASRLLDRRWRITRLFDRLAVESVLYQIFLVTTGLWSDSTGFYADFYADFWTQAERLLDRSLLFPTCSTSLNSPVLGVPVSLFRVTLSLRQQCRSRVSCDQAILDQIQSEVEAWEVALRCDQQLSSSSTNEPPCGQEKYYTDTGHLYAIIASVLLEHLAGNETSTSPAPTASSDNWQVKKAVQILRRYQHDDGWARLFIGNWPVYTLGFLMSSPDDMELIRADLQRRWDLTNFAQISRFSQDLEKTWAARKQVADNAMKACRSVSRG
ncbi:fungal-specific transcription factor domain-containing protein, partial [Ilyonectria destructans]